MTYQLYKMKLHTAHFGERLLEQSIPTIPVECLFSALFLEAIKIGKEDEFIERASQPDYVLTDTMLYHFGLYLPKPIGYPKIKRDQPVQEDSREIAKTIKEMAYVNELDFQDYTLGKINQYKELKELLNEQADLYHTTTQTRVGEDPYRVGLTRYTENTYLSFIGLKDDLTEELMRSLQYSGIGGKRTSGVGQFELELEKLSEETNEKLTTEAMEPVMLLTTALPRENQLEKVMDNAKYLLTKSSGFAYSEAVKENYRKQDLYKFKAGSTFDQTFDGDIYDVAPDEFSHPVWNFSKPLFLRLGVNDDGSA